MSPVKLINSSATLKYQFPGWLYAEHQITYAEFVKQFSIKEQIAIIWQFLGHSMVIQNSLTDDQNIQITQRLVRTYDKNFTSCQSKHITIINSSMSYKGYTLKDSLKHSLDSIKKLSLRDALIDYIISGIHIPEKKVREIDLLHDCIEGDLPF